MPTVVPEYKVSALNSGTPARLPYCSMGSWKKHVFTLILVPYEYHTRVPFQVWMLSKKLLRHYPQNWVLCRTKQSEFKVGVFLPVPRHWFPGSQPSGQPFSFLLPQPKILWDEIKQGQIILFLQLLFSNKNHLQIIYFSCASPKQ